MALGGTGGSWLCRKASRIIFMKSERLRFPRNRLVF